MRSHRSTRTESVKTMPFLASFFVALVFILTPLSSSAGLMDVHLKRLPQLLGQITMAEKDITVILEEKKHAQSQEDLARIVSELTLRHQDLVRISKEYEELRRHIRFEHPDRNNEVERQYIRHNLKTIREFEVGSGLDGRLDRVKSRALAIFPLPERPPRTTPVYTLRNPASIVEDEDAPEQVHLKK